MSGIHKAGAKFWGAAAMIGEQPMTWTPDTVEALAKDLDEASAYGISMDLGQKAASALTWALERIKEDEATMAHAGNLISGYMAERDAANARAERSRLDALTDACALVKAWHSEQTSQFLPFNVEREIAALKEAWK